MSPGYREAREWRRAEKLKAEELEPIKGTRAARKRATALATEQITERERQYEEALPFLSSGEEHLAVELGTYEEDSGGCQNLFIFTFFFFFMSKSLFPTLTPSVIFLLSLFFTITPILSKTIKITLIGC